jgi:hypothetical protein
MVLHISNVTEPRALAQIFEQAEASLASKLHPDPYIRESPHLFHITTAKASLTLAAPTMPGGTKWYVLNPMLRYSLFIEPHSPTGNAIYLYV